VFKFLTCIQRMRRFLRRIDFSTIR
jgi:hypothetical protein